MTGNGFYVFEARNTETGKTYAYTEKIPKICNLLCHMTAASGYELISASLCDSYKEALKVADFWNECAIKAGNHAFF